MDCLKVKLNNGLEMPILGLGTWNSKPNEVKDAIIHAVKAGYRHIDCAYLYQNEFEVGQALKQLFNDGIVKREDLFIVSKLWSTYHSPHLIEPAINKSLENLGLEYLDLYLIHWPMAFVENEGHFPRNVDNKIKCIKVDLLDTWKGMEVICNKGLSKSIGLSNFNHEQINRILSHCTIQPVNLQIECHPYLTQTKLINFCKSKNISVTAYCPLGSPGSPLTDDLKLLSNETILALANKYNKSAGQILIRFQIQRGVIVIPKSVKKDRIISNSEVFDFKLSDDDMKSLESLNKDHRICGDSNMIDFSDEWPFSIEF